MKQSEFLSPDILEDGLVKIFKPIHVSQWILGSLRIHVKANFATPVTILQKIYSYLWIVVVVVTTGYLERMYYEYFYGRNTTLFISFAIGIFWHCTAFVTNLLHIRFHWENECVTLYVTMQRINGILHLTEENNLNRKHYYANLIFVLSMWILLFVELIVYFVLILDPVVIITELVLITMYLELVWTCSLIVFLAVRLARLNKMIRDGMYFAVYKNTSDKKLWCDVDTNFSKKSNTMNEGELRRYLICLKLILNAFNTVAKVSSFQVLLMVSSAFICPLLVIEALIVGVGHKMYSATEIGTIIILVSFYFSQIVVLALFCDRFLRNVRETSTLCIEILARHYEGPLMKMAQEMLSVMEWQKPVFSVFGIFTMDRYLPLHLLRVVTDYVIILIQFTLL